MHAQKHGYMTQPEAQSSAKIAVPVPDGTRMQGWSLRRTGKRPSISRTEKHFAGSEQNRIFVIGIVIL
jgi:hypothetical protein